MAKKDIDRGPADLVVVSPMTVRGLIPKCALISAALFFLVYFAGTLRDAAALTDEQLETELRYIDGLNALGLYEYAALAQTPLPKDDPQVKVRQLQTFLVKGEFDKIEAAIAREPNPDGQGTWAMKLTLGDGYYAWGMYPEAKGLYQSFFKRYAEGPPESLRRFFLDSAYKYAQMLLLMGDSKGAIQAYQSGLKAKPERHIRRQFQSELAELHVKLGAQAEELAERDAHFAQVKKICDEILWVQDLWFGKAIVMLAHMLMVEGKTDEAMNLVEDFKLQLKAIDEGLKEESERTGQGMTKLSPMAECRYLVGVILQEEAVKLLDAGGDRQKALELLAGKKDSKGQSVSGAMQHFVNVFIRYPTTPWAPDAGKRAREVEALLKERLGKEVKWEATPEQWDQVEKAQFREARALYKQNQFKPASEAYVTVLNLFPRGENALVALGNLADCYIQMDEDLYAAMVVGHMAESFSKKAALSVKAGDQVLRIGSIYEERGRKNLCEEVFETFFENFPKHPRTANLLYKAAEERLEEQDIEGALDRFRRLAETHPSSPVALNALSKIASCYEIRGDKVEHIRALKTYIDKLESKERPGHALIVAKYRMARALRELDEKYLPTAFNQFVEIMNLLKDDPAPYFSNADEQKANQQILEGAMFSRASIYARMAPPSDKPEFYHKVQAVKAYGELVDRFPKSAFAPAALSQVGTLWTILEKPDEAEKALRSLQRDYPESNEAKNALFLLGMNLLELGRRDQAVKVFKQMFGDQAGQYTESQLLMAGTELQKAGEYEICLEAFERVLDVTKEAARIQPALLGKGQALIALEKYAEGATALEDLFERFPKSAVTIAASFALSKAYSELAMREQDPGKRFELFNLAVKAVKRYRQFDTSPVSRPVTNLRIAEIQELKMKAEQAMGSPEKAVAYRQEAIATYQTLILFENPDIAETRPHIETAYFKCMPLLIDAELWPDAIEDGDKYFETFGGGRHLLDMRKWYSKAKAKMAASGALVPGASQPEP